MECNSPNINISKCNGFKMSFIYVYWRFFSFQLTRKRMTNLYLMLCKMFTIAENVFFLPGLPSWFSSLNLEVAQLAWYWTPWIPLQQVTMDKVMFTPKHAWRSAANHLLNRLWWNPSLCNFLNTQIVLHTENKLTSQIRKTNLNEFSDQYVEEVTKEQVIIDWIFWMRIRRKMFRDC